MELCLCWRLPYSSHGNKSVLLPLTRVQSSLFLALLCSLVPIVKAMVFPVVMYGCESWIRKKAEHWRIDAFELWCWRGLLRVPWTVRGSNQTILKEINPEYSLEGLMLKLKLQYFGYLIQRPDSLEKAVMMGKIEGRRRKGQRMRWLDDIIESMGMSASSGRYWRSGKTGVLQSMGLQRVGLDLATKQQQYS